MTRTAGRRAAAPPPEPGDEATRLERAVAAVDARLGLDALRYPVPEHANNLGWSLGGLTAATFGILVVTGVLLAQFYNPTPEVANASVRHITEEVLLGRFTRALHFWAAQAMYVLAVLHLVRVFFHGSYRRPREANWLIGVSMFGLTFLAIFTGSVLKWDQEGYEALVHNLEIAELLGGAGFWFSPEFADEVPILLRLYTAHVMLIPLLLVLLITLHALLVKRHGISPHPALPTVVPDTPALLTPPAPTTRVAGHRAVDAGPGETYLEASEPFTHHVRRLGAFALVLLGGLSVLAVLFPPAVGPTPIAGIEVTKPMWPFWWMFTLENYFGLDAILWGGAALFALLVAVPFVDRNPARSWRARPVGMVLALVVVTLLVVLTVLMGVSTPVAHLE